jgi:hypothetical protein
VARENAEVVWSLIGDAFKYSNESGGSIDPGLSLMDYIREHVDERVEGQMGGKGSTDGYAVSDVCYHFNAGRFGS